MFKFKLDYKKAVNGLRQFARQSLRSSKEALGDTVAQIAEEMREPGKPSTSPVQWDSEKQRKAYFATDGFGHGIPYVRKGDYERGWTKAELPNGWQVSNKHPAGAVGGTLSGVTSLEAQGKTALSTWQSNIHRGRWKSFLVVAAQKISELPKRVIEKLRTRTK